jgi:hypothetical protein
MKTYSIYIGQMPMHTWPYNFRSHNVDDGRCDRGCYETEDLELALDTYHEQVFSTGASATITLYEDEYISDSYGISTNIKILKQEMGKVI